LSSTLRTFPSTSVTPRRGNTTGIPTPCEANSARVCARYRISPGPATYALQACGQRSLTFYLFQSVVWLTLFYPFTFGLHDELGFAAACAVAAGVWGVSVLLAEWMRRAGKRGNGQQRPVAYLGVVRPDVVDLPHFAVHGEVHAHSAPPSVLRPRR
jgi:hypothetical protein